jgi:hypothetical protein
LILLAAFFFPVALYLLVLGVLNRRPHPVVVRGTWDCAGLLFACSGAVLFAGPALLLAFYHRDVRDFLLRAPPWKEAAFNTLLVLHWSFWLLYYVTVVIGSGLLIWWRGRTTAVYNIEPALLDHTLAQVLDRLGLEWTRLGERVFIGFPRGPGRVHSARATGWPPPFDTHFKVGATPLPGEKARPSEARPDQETVFDVVPFAAARHVSLVWRTGPRALRAEIESALRRSLREVLCPPNPAGTWFLMIAGALFALIFLGVAITIVVELLKRSG